MTIILQGRRTSDIVYLGLYVAWLGLVVGLVIDGVFHGSRDDPGIGVFAVLTLPVLAWAFMGSVSRLRNHQPFFQADAQGLRLHPSFAPAPLPWSAIRSLSIQSDPYGRSRGLGARGQIRVLLREPSRSLSYPWGSLEVRMRLMDLDLSHREAADLLRRLKVLRGSGAHAEDDV
ncbi:hypothetical protein [Caulobacter soli]|uniref:hypothetical protein n=1 Tax=Caulobacter soli TaxID=2708539 RepID=UPI0013EA9888|nr:hypothetical protein [Caulobacter soli]